MTTQPEALRLADELDGEFVQGRISNHTGRKAATELRRLHATNADLEEAVRILSTVVSERDRQGGLRAGMYRRSYRASSTPPAVHHAVLPCLVRAAIEKAEEA